MTIDDDALNLGRHDIRPNHMTKAQQRDSVRTADHEAEHAVIACICGFTPYRASIKAGVNETGEHRRGEVRIKLTELDFIFAPRLSAIMLYELAGIAAQNRYSRRRIDDFETCDGGSADVQEFDKHWFELFTLTDGKCPDEDDFKIAIIQMVRHYWSAIDAFARLLLERRTIEHEELRVALYSITHDCEYIPYLWDDKTWVETGGVIPGPLPFSYYTELEAAASQLASRFRTRNKSANSAESTNQP